MTSLVQDRRYCEQILRDSHSSFRTAFATLDRPRRQALSSLYAFCRLIDDIADRCQEKEVARIQLAWWRQEIFRVFSRSADTEIPQHPVGRCLKDDSSRFNFDFALFEAILDGVESDLDVKHYDNREQLMRYCYQVSSCVGLLSIQIFGYERREMERYATQLGYALQLTNIIRDVRPDARRGRVYLPSDELRACRIDPQSLARLTTTPDALREYLTRLGLEVQQLYRQAFAILHPGEYHRQLAGIVMGYCYWTLLDEMARDGYRVMEYIINLPPHRKLAILVRCWWGSLWRIRLGAIKPRPE